LPCTDPSTGACGNNLHNYLYLGHNHWHTLSWKNQSHVFLREHVSSNSSTVDSYLGGVCFESEPGHWLLWLRSFKVFLSPSKQMLEEYISKISTEFHQVQQCFQ
jgi:hypothetical protein